LRSIEVPPFQGNIIGNLTERSTRKVVVVIDVQEALDGSIYPEAEWISAGNALRAQAEVPSVR
jgi:hypothetical protein